MRIIERAIKTAYKLHPISTERFFHTCFLFDKNKLISIGQNNTSKENIKARYFGQRFNVPQFIKFSFPHAEIDCIGRLWGKRVITGRERLVVIRIGNSGRLLQSKPCSSCSTILRAIGFKSVFHSVEGSVIESEL